MLAQKPPKGVATWELQLVSEYRRSRGTRFGVLKDLRSWATGLYSTRLIRFKPEPDYAAITDGGVPLDDGHLGLVRKSAVRRFWLSLKFKPFPKVVPQRVR